MDMPSTSSAALCRSTAVDPIILSGIWCCMELYVLAQLYLQAYGSAELQGLVTFRHPISNVLHIFAGQSSRLFASQSTPFRSGGWLSSYSGCHLQLKASSSSFSYIAHRRT